MRRHRATPATTGSIAGTCTRPYYSDRPIAINERGRIDMVKLLNDAATERTHETPVRDVVARPAGQFPRVRMRRNRPDPWTRRLVAENTPTGETGRGSGRVGEWRYGAYVGG